MRCSERPLVPSEVAGRLLAGAQNAAGIVLEALQEDGESDDGQKKPDTGGAEQ